MEICIISILITSDEISYFGRDTGPLTSICNYGITGSIDKLHYGKWHVVLQKPMAKIRVIF